MAQRLSSRVLAGRDPELGQLVAAMERCVAGSPSVVLVGGEAGVGKSRLLAELAARAADEDVVRVLRGQCADLEEAAIPLLAVVNAVRELVDDEIDLLAALDRAGARHEAAPAARLHALVLDRLAGESGPILLVVEDVHWADRSTLDLLAFLARRLREERVMIVASYRNDEVDRRDALRRFLADVATAPTAERLELHRLDRDAMREQIAGILDEAPADDLVDAIFARSEGNPFFAEELVAASAAGAPDALPPTLRDMLLARLGTLEADAQAVVRVAAAGGHEIHHELLAAAAELDEPRLTEALRAAVRHQVLVADDDGFAFRHALLQEAAYGELLPGERARAHAAFAAALEAAPDAAGGNAATVAAEIAHHWLRAGDEPRALVAAVRAGAEAERIGALAETARHDARALELWDAVPDAATLAGIDRATLLAHAAHATAWTGRPAEGVAFADAALALLDADAEPLRVAHVRQRRGFYLWQLGRTREGVADLERAVALIPVEPPSAQRAGALGQLGLALMFEEDYAGARDSAEAAIAVARSIDARAEEADAMVCLGQVLGPLGEPGEGVALLERAHAIAAELDDDELLSHVGVGLSDMLWRVGRLADAVDAGLEGGAAARRVGLEVREVVSRLNAAEAALELGDWPLADELSRDALARNLSAVAMAFGHHVAGEVACARGDLDGAAAHVAAHRDRLGNGALLADALEDEAELALWQRRPEAAAQAAREGIGVKDTMRRPRVVWLGVRAEADRAELARARRDAAAEDGARERARALAAGARDAEHPALEATIAAEVARVEGDADPALWEAAAAAWDSRSTPFHAAYARWRQAEAALASRDREQAAAALLAADATAADLGARALAAELEALARRARIALPEREPAPPEAEPAAPSAADELGLTARELEVLEHLALGQTNRQIAEELFISVKTAGVHVSHILSKLGAANRGEAGAIAHRLGLVP